jgi:hypothetical protein
MIAEIIPEDYDAKAVADCSPGKYDGAADDE